VAIDLIRLARAEIKKLRQSRGLALREAKILREKLKRAETALTFYAESAIVEEDCGYTARVALQDLAEDSNDK